MQQHIDRQSQFWNWLWKHSRYIYVKMCMQDIEVSFGSSETGYVNICLMVMVLNQRVYTYRIRCALFCNAAAIKHSMPFPLNEVVQLMQL